MNHIYLFRQFRQQTQRISLKCLILGSNKRKYLTLIKYRASILDNSESFILIASLSFWCGQKKFWPPPCTHATYLEQLCHTSIQCMTSSIYRIYCGYNVGICFSKALCKIVGKRIENFSHLNAVTMAKPCIHNSRIFIIKYNRNEFLHMLSAYTPRQCYDESINTIFYSFSLHICVGVEVLLRLHPHA